MALSLNAARTALFPIFTRPTAFTLFNTASLRPYLPLRPLLLPSISLPAISLNIPDLVSDIWEGILKAVPKKKTSHSKKRHRQLAGKALKDVRAVNTCSACGRPKKAHTLCPFCVADIKQEWQAATKEAAKRAHAEADARTYGRA